MKKLLHERLREIKNSDCESLAAVAGVKCHAFCNRYACHKEIYKALADEIEKYYIPRPRFEDGEPVRVGDSFIQKCINEEVELSKIGIALYTSDCLNMVWFPDEVVPRPAPKVLDADGVEIKVGDTIYSTQTGVKLTVIEIINQNGHNLRVRFDDGTMSYAMGNLYTHREPDSLEKLRDDIAEWRADVAIPGNGWDIKTAEWCDRLTALIERGA